MQKKSKLLYQGCVSTLIYRAIALLFVPPPPPQPEMGNDEMIGDHLSHRICPRSREENEDQSRELPMSQRGRGVDRDDRNVMRCGLTRALHALAASPLL